MVTSVHLGFRVADYEPWKRSFDEHLEARKAGGEISYQVFRSVDDPNRLTVITVHDNAEQVRAFLDSPELKTAMQSAGVLEMGPMMVMEEVDRGVH